MILDKVVFDFLKQLAVNNSKEWFHANKPLYQEAKIAFEKYVQYLIGRTSEIDRSVKNLNAKDCVFRIFRDIRFAKDKTPYKNNFGAYIVEGGRKSVFAGYYFHIEPDNSFIGGGIYCPQPEQLLAVRKQILSNSKTFKSIINNSEFKKVFPEIYGEKLKSAPRGFDKNFDDIELLRYKSYTFVKNTSDKDISSKNLSDNIIKVFGTLKPVNDYLNKAIRI